MNINTFIDISSNLPPHIAVLMRGGTGIGKSAIVNQISNNINLPLYNHCFNSCSESCYSY